jgi:hypothetical protein
VIPRLRIANGSITSESRGGERKLLTEPVDLFIVQLRPVEKPWGYDAD